MNEKERLSIIIPVFNTKPQKLDECLKSIQESWKNAITENKLDISVHLIDDGSTRAETIEYIKDYHCEEYAISKTFIPKNSGRSYARNLGLSMAESEWITFIDSDDLVLENYFSVSSNYLNKYSNCEVISFAYFINKLPVLRYAIKKNCSYATFKYKSICTCFIRKDFLLKNNIKFDNKMDSSEDIKFLEELESVTKPNKGIHVNIPLYIYEYDFKSYNDESNLKKILRKPYYFFKFTVIKFFLRTKLISDHV